MKHAHVISLLLVMGFLSSPLIVTASSAGQSPHYSSDETVGDHTRDWLELQRRGEQASTTEQTLAPAVRDRTYERYLKSFEQPIPDAFYSRDRFREGN